MQPIFICCSNVYKIAAFVQKAEINAIIKWQL